MRIPSRESFLDSVYHYSMYSNNPFKWVSRAFKYEILQWPDGINPKNYSAVSDPDGWYG